MKVIVGCEFTQEVTKAFRDKGHEAYSCDLQPTEGNPDWHIQGDILELLNDSWDLMIAFPPCTRLSKVSGAHWKKEEFQKEQSEALDFVRKLMDAPIRHIAIENPVGKINTAIRKPDQIIHPFYFGDPWMKETCLWLKNLPLLTFSLTNNLFEAATAVEPIGNWVKPGNRRPHRRFYEIPEGGNGNAKDRSRTFPKIAEAMATQWSAFIEKERCPGEF